MAATVAGKRKLDAASGPGRADTDIASKRAAPSSPAVVNDDADDISDDMACLVTDGAVQQLIATDGAVSAGKCMLQVVEVKGLTGNRTRVALSDGKVKIQALLSSGLTDKWVGSEQLKLHSIITLKECVMNKVKDTTILIVVELSVYERDVNCIIGAPVPLEQQQQQQLSPLATSSPINVESKREYSGGRGRGGSGGGGPCLGWRGGRGGSVGGGGTPAASSALWKAPREFHHIQMLSPFQPNTGWTIKARVTARSEVRTFMRNGYEGSVASVDLIDAQGGEISAKMFTEEVKRFYDILDVGRVFVFSRFSVQVVKEQRYATVANDYDLTLSAHSVVLPTTDGDDEIEHAKYNFVSFDHFVSDGPQDWREERSVDIIGCVKRVGDPFSFESKKNGTSMTKRSITLIDQTGMCIDLVVWNDVARKWTSEVLVPGAIFVAKGCRVNDYNGSRSLSMQGSNCSVNPERQAIVESKALREWWGEQGHMAPENNITVPQVGGAAPRKSIAAIRDERLGLGEKPDYITLRATVLFVKHGFTESPPWYMACPLTRPLERDPSRTMVCNKKVRGSDDEGGYFCDQCAGQSVIPVRRYTLSVMIADSTGNSWMSAFNDVAERILGNVSADTLDQYIAEGDESRFESVFTGAHFRTFTLKCKVERERDTGRFGTKNGDGVDD